MAILDDFAKLTVFGQRDAEAGQRACASRWATPRSCEQFVRAIKGEPNHLLSWEDAALATTCMFAAQESIRLGAEIDLAPFRRSLVEEATNLQSADQPMDKGEDDPDGKQAGERVPLG